MIRRRGGGREGKRRERTTRKGAETSRVARTDFNYGICTGETLNFPVGTCPPSTHPLIPPSLPPRCLVSPSFRLSLSSLWVCEPLQFQFRANPLHIPSPPRASRTVTNLSPLPTGRSLISIFSRRVESIAGVSSYAFAALANVKPRRLFSASRGLTEGDGNRANVRRMFAESGTYYLYNKKDDVRENEKERERFKRCVLRSVHYYFECQRLRRKN